MGFPTPMHTSNLVQYFIRLPKTPAAWGNATVHINGVVVVQQSGLEFN